VFSSSWCQSRARAITAIESRKRVLENVFEGAVVEQVLDFEVEPDRSYGADAGAGV